MGISVGDLKRRVEANPSLINEDARYWTIREKSTEVASVTSSLASAIRSFEKHAMQKGGDLLKIGADGTARPDVSKVLLNHQGQAGILFNPKDYVSALKKYADNVIAYEKSLLDDGKQVSDFLKADVIARAKSVSSAYQNGVNPSIVEASELFADMVLSMDSEMEGMAKITRIRNPRSSKDGADVSLLSTELPLEGFLSTYKKAVGNKELTFKDIYERVTSIVEDSIRDNQKSSEYIMGFQDSEGFSSLRRVDENGNDMDGYDMGMFGIDSILIKPDLKDGESIEIRANGGAVTPKAFIDGKLYDVEGRGDNYAASNGTVIPKQNLVYMISDASSFSVKVTDSDDRVINALDKIDVGEVMAVTGKINSGLRMSIDGEVTLNTDLSAYREAINTEFDIQRRRDILWLLDRVSNINAYAYSPDKAPSRVFFDADVGMMTEMFSKDMGAFVPPLSLIDRSDKRVNEANDSLEKKSNLEILVEDAIKQTEGLYSSVKNVDVVSTLLNFYDIDGSSVKTGSGTDIKSGQHMEFISKNESTKYLMSKISRAFNVDATLNSKRDGKVIEYNEINKAGVFTLQKDGRYVIPEVSDATKAKRAAQIDEVAKYLSQNGNISYEDAKGQIESKIIIAEYLARINNNIVNFFETTAPWATYLKENNERVQAKFTKAQKEEFDAKVDQFQSILKGEDGNSSPLKPLLASFFEYREIVEQVKTFDSDLGDRLGELSRMCRLPKVRKIGDYQQMTLDLLDDLNDDKGTNLIRKKLMKEFEKIVEIKDSNAPEVTVDSIGYSLINFAGVINMANSVYAKEADKAIIQSVKENIKEFIVGDNRTEGKGINLFNYIESIKKDTAKLDALFNEYKGVLTAQNDKLSNVRTKLQISYDPLGNMGKTFDFSIAPEIFLSIPGIHREGENKVIGIAGPGGNGKTYLFESASELFGEKLIVSGENVDNTAVLYGRTDNADLSQENKTYAINPAEYSYMKGSNLSVLQDETYQSLLDGLKNPQKFGINPDKTTELLNKLRGAEERTTISFGGLDHVVKRKNGIFASNFAEGLDNMESHQKRRIKQTVVTNIAQFGNREATLATIGNKFIEEARNLAFESSRSVAVGDFIDSTINKLDNRVSLGATAYDKKKAFNDFSAYVAKMERTGLVDACGIYEKVANDDFASKQKARIATLVELKYNLANDMAEAKAKNDSATIERLNNVKKVLDGFNKDEMIASNFKSAINAAIVNNIYENSVKRNRSIDQTLDESTIYSTMAKKSYDRAIGSDTVKQRVKLIDEFVKACSDGKNKAIENIAKDLGKSVDEIKSLMSERKELYNKGVELANAQRNYVESNFKHDFKEKPNLFYLAGVMEGSMGAKNPTISGDIQKYVAEYMSESPTGLKAQSKEFAKWFCLFNNFTDATLRSANIGGVNNFNASMYPMLTYPAVETFVSVRKNDPKGLLPHFGEPKDGALDYNAEYFGPSKENILFVGTSKVRDENKKIYNNIMGSMIEGVNNMIQAEHLDKISLSSGAFGKGPVVGDL